MKFNKYINDKNDNNIFNYVGGFGSGGSLDSGCLCVLVIFIILIYVLQNVDSKEMFSTYNKTIPPDFISNPNKVFDQTSKFKKKTYNSNINFTNGCDDECVMLQNNIGKMYMPHDVVNAEFNLHNDVLQKDANNYLSNNIINSKKDDLYNSSSESFTNYNNRTAYQNSSDGSLYDYECNRPQFIENKLNNTMLGRVWSYNHNNCNTLDLSQNQWSLNEGFIGDKNSNDSMILPFRSLPEYKVVEKFENQNILTYNANKCSDREDIIGFDQTSKCCYRDNEKASLFQNLNENDLKDTLKLLDYVSGDLHHDNLNSSNYDNIQELPSLSNQNCPF